MTQTLSGVCPRHVVYAVSDIFNALQQEIASVEERMERPRQLGLAATALRLELDDLKTVFDTVKSWQNDGATWARTDSVLADPFPLHRSVARDGLVAQIRNGLLKP